MHAQPAATRRLRPLNAANHITIRAHTVTPITAPHAGPFGVHFPSVTLIMASPYYLMAFAAAGKSEPP